MDAAVLLVFGATGATGRALVEQGLAAGHRVTAFVRDRARLALSHPALSVEEGDVTDAARVRAVVPGHDAVLCALGAPPARSGVRAEGTKQIAAAMAEASVRRLLVVSSHGVHETAAELPWIMRHVIVPYYLSGAFKDHEAQEDIVSGSDLDFTIVRPPHLGRGPAKGQFRVDPALSDRPTWKIDRADVAAFMLSIVRDSAFFRRTVTVSNVQS